jgi:hypothetical protein
MVREAACTAFGQRAAANLRLSTAIELGQFGTGCVMLTRSPAVGPSADMQMSSLPLSSGMTMYLATACVKRSTQEAARAGAHLPPSHQCG